MIAYQSRPLLGLSMAALLGCLTAIYFPRLVQPWLLYAPAAGALAIWVWKRNRWNQVWCLTGTWLVYALLAARCLTVPADEVSHQAPRRFAGLQGTLGTIPEPKGGGRWSAILKVEQIAWHGPWQRAGGRVLLSVQGPLFRGMPGDRLLVLGSLEALEPPMNPGEWDHAQHLARQRVYAQFRVRGREDLVRLARAPGWHWGAWGGQAHWQLFDTLARHVPQPGRGVVAALLVGDRSGLNLRAQNLMAQAGLSHLLAVSGMNVTLVLGSVLGLSRLVRLPAVFSVPAGIAGVGVFVLATGASPPVLRAGLMAAAAAFGWFGGYRVEAASSLGMAALLLLAWDPLSADTASFQLSFAATAGLIFWVPPIDRSGSWSRRALGALATLSAATVAAVLATLPLSLRYFSSVTPAAVISNLASAPLVLLITDGGLLLAGLAGFFPALAGIVGSALGWTANLLMRVAEVLGGLPGARVWFWPAGGFWVLSAYLAMGAMFLKPVRWPGCALLIFLAIGYVGSRPSAPEPGETRALFLCLNIGEACLVETQDHRSLIDTGTENEFFRRVMPALLSRGVNRLDSLILSHGDADHAGGAEACIRTFRPSRIWTAPGQEARLGGARRAALQYGAGWQVMAQGDERSLGRYARISAHWPLLHAGDGGNAESLVCVWESSGARLLFCGDLPRQAESGWVCWQPCQVFKAAHHGSRFSNGERLLFPVAPQLSVVTPGRRNPHGHPARATLARLKRASGQVLDAGALGAIEITLRQGQEPRWCCVR